MKTGCEFWHRFIFSFHVFILLFFVLEFLLKSHQALSFASNSQKGFFEDDR